MGPAISQGNTGGFTLNADCFLVYLIFLRQYGTIRQEGIG
jgi:hypothetical protein